MATLDKVPHLLHGGQWLTERVKPRLEGVIHLLYVRILAEGHTLWLFPTVIRQLSDMAHAEQLPVGSEARAPEDFRLFLSLLLGDDVDHAVGLQRRLSQGLCHGSHIGGDIEEVAELPVTVEQEVAVVSLQEEETAVLHPVGVLPFVPEEVRHKPLPQIPDVPDEVLYLFVSNDSIHS